MLILYVIKITLITGMAVKEVKPERFAARVIYDGSSMVNLVAYIGWLTFGRLLGYLEGARENAPASVGAARDAGELLDAAGFEDRPR